MGAAASADFYKQLVVITQKIYHAQNDDDFPPMWIYNLPIRDFDETGFVDTGSVKNQLVESVKKMEAVGSDFIVIPCNTVHHFYSEMQAAVDIPILNLLEATAEAVEKREFKKVGLLTSQSTRKYKLYETILANHGIAALSASDSEQQEVNKVIGNVIAGMQGAADVSAIQKVVERYLRDGAQVVVLGCTELPLAFSQTDCSVSLFSSTEVLAEAALRFARI